MTFPTIISLPKFLILLTFYSKGLAFTFTSGDLLRFMKSTSYSNHDPPRLSSATDVKLGIYVIGIYSISEQTMDYSLSINLKLSWNDPRLKFKPWDKNQTWVKFDQAWNYLWIPDVAFINEKSAFFHKVTMDNRLAIITTDGNVYYNTKISTTLMCPMMLNKYPLDTQVCPMVLESFGYTTDVMQMSWADNPVDMDKDMHLPQYFLVGHRLLNCTQYYQAGSFSCLKIKFILKRDLGYFTIQVFFPTFLIVILSWVSFWISVDAAPARVSLGLLTVLTMANLSIGINSNLPRVSYVKAIDIWMSACLLFVFSALCEYAFVNVACRHKVITKHVGLLPQHHVRDHFACLKKSIRREPIELPTAQSGAGLVPQAAMIPLPKPARPLDGKARAERIDDISRKCFPLVFIVFNIVYWIGFIHIIKDEVAD